MYKDRSQITAGIAFAIKDELAELGIAAQFGASNVSASAYVETDDKKLRISDHSDYHGSDHTLRADSFYRDIFYVYSPDGEDSRIVSEADLEELPRSELETAEFAGCEIDDDDYRRLVDEGVHYLSGR